MTTIRFTRLLPRAAVRAVLLLLSTSLLSTGAALAQPAPSAPLTGREGSYVIRDFRFGSGETLPELRLHYRTFGTPRRDAGGTVRNAVLLLHGTTGSSASLLAPSFSGELFGPGQPLDTAVHYVILRDGIGHGKSSKPSDGLRGRFPKYDYDDMVTADHRLLTEHLGVNHLRLVMGTSMGGMHSWVWGAKYPGFMDGLVPLASIPAQIAGRNRMIRRMAMDDIRNDPAWQGGDYTVQPPGLRAALQLLYIMSSAPLVQQREAPTRDAADSVIGRWLDARFAAMDANDMLYAFDASRNYDPSVSLERITAPLLAINSDDDQINPPELRIIERLMPRVARGRLVMLPITDATRGHGSHTWAALWKHELVAFMEQLPPLR